MIRDYHFVALSAKLCVFQKERKSLLKQQQEINHIKEQTASFRKRKPKSDKGIIFNGTGT